MKLGFQGNNKGNGKLVLTADNLKFACQELGILVDKDTRGESGCTTAFIGRAARAFALYHSGKVEYESTDARRLTVTFRVASQCNRQDPYDVKIKQSKYLKAGGYAYCTCQDWMKNSGDMDVPDVTFWCKHSIAALIWLHRNNGNGNLTSRIVNECGSAEVKALQNKLNGQLKGNGKGVPSTKAPSLDLSNPFVEATT